MRTRLLALAFLFFYLNSTAQLPDFKTGISFSYGYSQQDKELNLTWDFFNVGGAATSSFTIAYIATLDMNIGPEDYLIGSKSYGSAVANAFATVTFTYGFAPDDLPSGLYNFVVYLDYGNKIAESNENNNIISFGTFNFVSTPTGTSKFPKEDSNLFVYPNPASDLLTLDFNNLIGMENLNYKLYNFSGQELLSENLEQEATVTEKKISVTDLPTGIYFLNLRTSGEIISTKKIVIKRDD